MDAENGDTMPNMKRDEYMTALAAIKCVTNPTVEQMLSICPHLTEEQMLAAFMRLDDGTVALPPLKVRGSFHLAHYHPGGAGERQADFYINPYGQRSSSSYADASRHDGYLCAGPQLPLHG